MSINFILDPGCSVYDITVSDSWKIQFQFNFISPRFEFEYYNRFYDPVFERIISDPERLFPFRVCHVFYLLTFLAQVVSRYGEKETTSFVSYSNGLKDPNPYPVQTTSFVGCIEIWIRFHLHEVEKIIRVK